MTAVPVPAPRRFRYRWTTAYLVVMSTLILLAVLLDWRI